jgi:hypothetical protein
MPVALHALGQTFLRFRLQERESAEIVADRCRARVARYPMRWLRVLVLAGFGGLVFGCSDGPAANGGVTDVSGDWCGKRVATSAECLGDEVSYLELTQSTDGAVSGVRCEHFEKECYDLHAASFDGRRLTFYYTFDVYRVDGDFTSAGASTLSGALHSDKCDCETPGTLYRIPE